MATDRIYTFESQIAVLKIGRILRLIENTSLTDVELAAKIHLTIEGMRHYIRYLHKNKMIYITSWNLGPVCDQRAYPRARYRAGKGQDVKKPPRQTQSMLAKKYRERLKKDSPAEMTKVERYLAKRRHEYHQRRLQQLIEEGYVVPGFQGLDNRRITLGPKNKSPTPDQIAQIVKLRDSGMSYNAISITMNMSKSTVYSAYIRLRGANAGSFEVRTRSRSQEKSGSNPNPLLY